MTSSALRAFARPLSPVVATTLLGWGSALAQTATVQVEYGLDATDDGIWPNLTANATPAGLDRDHQTGVTYRAISQTIGNVANSYTINGGSTSNQNNGLFLPDGGTNDAYGDTDQFGNGFTLANTTFEIVFRLNNITNARRILWETGGATGTSFTTDANVLQFRHRSNNSEASVTYDLNSLGTHGDGRNPAVADFIMVHGNVDLGNNSIELFVNGQSVGVDGAGGAANDGLANSATNISDWDGGDGDGIGNHGGGNLGGFGSGFNFDGGNYTSVAGDIAGFRIYQETGAASQSGALLDATAIGDRFDALFSDPLFSATSGAWSDVNTWSPVNIPEAHNIAIIGGGTHTVTVNTVIGDDPGKVLVGHDLGTNDGNGVLTIANGGELNVVEDVLIGSSNGNNRRGTLNVNDGGILTVAGDIVYGAGGNEGGTINIRDGANGTGTLTVNNIIERVSGVDSAQLHLDGGTLNLLGDTITVQSFRTGNATAGSYTLAAEDTITNTGTFFAGNNAVGTFTNDGGTILVSNAIRLSENAGGAGSSIANDAGTIDVVGGQVDIGRRGDGTLTVNGGTVTAGVLGGAQVATRFANDSGTATGTLNVAGGTYIAHGSIVTPGGAGNINLTGGVLYTPDLQAVKTVTNYTHDTGAILRVGIADGSAGPTLINVTGTADFPTAGAVIEIEDERAGSNPGSLDTWIGGSGEWDLTDANWETDTMLNLIPANGSGALVNGTPFDLLAAGTLSNPGNVASGTPDWTVINPDASTIAIRYDGPTSGTGPITAVIDDAASIVTRETGLRIAAETGADAAGLNIGDGSLTLEDTLLADPVDLTIGGGAQGTINQTGGMVTVNGSLFFGENAASPQGGIYNLDAGTLSVTGDIAEQADTVNNAQLHLNGGTLNLGPASTVTTQRFSLAEAPATNVNFEPANDFTTTGTTAVGHGDGSTATLTLNDPARTMTAANASVPQGNGNAATVSGTFDLLAGTFQTTAGNFNIAGDNQNKTNTTGNFTMGMNGGDDANTTVNVTGGNSEWGHGGTGTVTIHSGNYNQLTNNIVLAQGANATSVAIVNGGMVNIHAAGDVNFNRGDGTLAMNGGTLEMRDMNLGNNSGTSDMTFTLNGGLVIVNRDIDYRNNGLSDVINIAGGELRFSGTTGPGVIHFGNRTIDGGGTQEFNFTGGLVSGLETFNGDLLQQGGTLAPGMSPGTTAVTGDYGMEPGSTLEVELDWDGVGLATAGINYDQVTVGGGFDAGGANLDVVVLNPALSNAPIGSTFVIVQGAAAPVGTFAQGAGVNVDGLNFMINYGGVTGLDVELVFIGAGPGDTDNDGVNDLLEMAFGTDPGDPTDGPSGLPTVSASGGMATIRWRQLENPGNLLYDAEVSTDLVSWGFTAGALAADQTGAPAGIDFWEASVAIDPGTPGQFLRIRVLEDE